MKHLSILIVDDEKNIRRSMQLILAGEGHRVQLAENAAEAMRLLEQAAPDLIFLDVMLPDEDGLSLLPKIRQSRPQSDVVMISGHANLSMAVAATRAGAYDFLEKPLQKEKILLVVRHVQERLKLRSDVETLRGRQFDEYRMIGESPAIRRIQEDIARVAPTDSKVLILGESGTGKELVAWAVHRQSPRRDKPFVKMNCAAIPDELTESELFGYEKGAFTGAVAAHDGKFLQADGGTLFLDEIADTSLRVQTKLLRVLQDGTFQRIGGKTTLRADVRVIAATNRNLEEMVRQGRFREDLYYRLNVFPIHVPALRERKEDIPLLFDYFLHKYCAENNRRPVSVDSEVMDALRDYPWPGNIRELRNLAERLMILLRGERVGLSDLPADILRGGGKPSLPAAGALSLKQVRENAEREYIRHCLRASNWNVSRAAEMLGLERTNLHKRMKALGIRRE